MFLAAGPAVLCGVAAYSAQPRIKRRDLVTRHNPENRRIDPRSPLTVGNGEFAFTADVTGLQSLPGIYEKVIPLCTQSHWGWHSFPGTGGLGAGSLRLTPYDTYGRPVGYATSADGQQELYTWLRENPHRLHLGRIGLLLDGGQIRAEAIDSIWQTLDLWAGILHSSFELDGAPVAVETCCHPQHDMIGVTVRSTLLQKKRLALCLEFPYGSPLMPAADWTRADRHTSRLARRSRNLVEISRELDEDRYFALVGWEGNGSISQEAPHRFVAKPGDGEARMGVVCGFSRTSNSDNPPGPGAVFKASSDHWAGFWSRGGAVELAGSRDPRAKELERRVVLSQYLTAIQCAGSMPPQETGLVCNSWNGKFHLEMHWWHAAHFPLWGREGLLERSVLWYGSILKSARQRAADQGYRGARWPKMTGPEGMDSPSPIGPLLIWQQPHPIAFAELCYQAHSNKETLERYREIVFASADFLASYAVRDPGRPRYVLGPPLIPAQENHPPRDTWNPAFELEYWAEGLRIAQLWRSRLGMPPDPGWEEVRTHLSDLPTRDGLYLAHENCPQTFTERNRDHPSMLGALGVLPGSKVDRETMRRTLKKVLSVWRWEDTWGWDFPMVAMTATRLGEPALAVDALMMDTPKNTWLPNGHNWQRANLPVYLPGNGGLLAAAALMCAGWREGPEVKTPGFPAGSWTVRWEGLKTLVD